MLPAMAQTPQKPRKHTRPPRIRVPNNEQAVFTVDTNKYVGVIRRLSLTGGSAVLSKGPIPQGTLAQMDEFNVALHDGTSWYRSWARVRVKVEVRDPMEKHRELLHQYTDADVHNIFAYLETLK